MRQVWQGKPKRVWGFGEQDGVFVQLESADVRRVIEYDGVELREWLLGVVCVTEEQGREVDMERPGDA